MYSIKCTQNILIIFNRKKPGYVDIPATLYLLLCPASVSRRFCGTLETDDVCRQTHINLTFFMHIINFVECLLQFRLQLFVHFIFIPVVALVVLYPLEV